MPRRLAATLVAAAGLLVAAPAAQSAVTIGSNLNGTGTNGPGGCNTICTGTNLNLPAANTAPNGLVSPINGVVVRWRVRTGSTGGNPVALRVLRPAGGTSFTGAGTSTSQTLTAETAPTGVADFPTRLSIRANDSVGLNPGNSALVWSNNPGATVAHWSVTNGFPNGLADGQTGAGLTSNQELMVQAVVEADADNDGFGDETQDQCPGDPSRQTLPCSTGPTNPTANPTVTADTTRPVVSQIQVNPKTFHAGTLLPRLTGTRRIATGTRISWRQSERARTRLLFDQARPGRRRGTRCVLQTRRVNTGRRCTFYSRRGTLSYNGRQGLNALRFQGRLTASRRIPPGRYRLTFSSRDRAGNTSVTRRTTFRMLPAPRRR